MSVSRAKDRLARIAEAHQKDTAGGNVDTDFCTECTWAWPCPTYVWATNDSLHPALDPWNPHDHSAGDRTAET